VYVYVGGKLDWLAAGLPSEGMNATRSRAGDVARRDVPTCRLEEPMHAAKFMVAHDLPNSPITTSDGKLIGLLRREDVTDSRKDGDDHECE